MEEYEKVGRELADRVWPAMSKEKVAKVLTKAIMKSVSKALHEANATYLNCGVPGAHVAMIEVRNRAVALQRAADLA